MELETLDFSYTERGLLPRSLKFRDLQKRPCFEFDNDIGLHRHNWVIFSNLKVIESHTGLWCFDNGCNEGPGRCKTTCGWSEGFGALMSIELDQNAVLSMHYMYTG